MVCYIGIPVYADAVFTAMRIGYRLFLPDYGVDYMDWAEQDAERAAGLLGCFCLYGDLPG